MMNRSGFAAVVIILLCSFQGSSADYDFIVVGAGPAGCIVASKLAETGKRTLLLEAGPATSWAFGGRDQKPFFQQHGGNSDVTVFDIPGENERLRKNDAYWWQHIPWALQGRGVGGSGMVNAALTFKPSPRDFDLWPSGWKFSDLEPFFDEAFEKTKLTSTPSKDGKLYAQGTGEAFEELSNNQFGFSKVELNANPGSRVNTMSVTQVTVDGGQRSDACMAYLLPAMNSRSNLELRTNSEVKKIAMGMGGLAGGVELTDGSSFSLNPGGKLVMTAGPLNTPRILLMSGIGPNWMVSQNSDHGLVLNGNQYWVDNWALARSMHDHTFTVMNFRVPDTKKIAFRYYVDKYVDSELSRYFNSRSGPYAQYGPVRVGFIARDGVSDPEVELLVMTSGQEGSSDQDCDNCYRILLMLMHETARDFYKLSKWNGFCDCETRKCGWGEVCKPNLYLANSEDFETMRWAVQKIAKAAEAEGYEVLTPSGSGDDTIKNFLQNDPVAKLSASHYAGTCAIGTCTDADLRVEGTENIYVADSSLFPAPIHAHNVGTVFAVAAKAAQHITKEPAT
ncbi:hypothetical protein BSKO_10419 [Bryopsis sp. KO-2023]|nr:hypothetical protein BSKO_10419 [Bryopsis sp. KO-2023]